MRHQRFCRRVCVKPSPRSGTRRSSTSQQGSFHSDVIGYQRRDVAHTSSMLFAEKRTYESFFYCLLDPQLVRYTPTLISFLVCCQGYCGRRRGGAPRESTIKRFVWPSRCAVDAVTCVRRRGGALRGRGRYHIERRTTLIRAHTLQSGHATACGFELAQQRSRYPKPLL